MTPIAYDDYNTREIPRSAAELLIAGRALDASSYPVDLPAPVEAVIDRLTLNLPASSVATMPESYCEAVLRVREELPAARNMFVRVHEEAEKRDACYTLADRLAAELARQQGIRPPRGRLYSLITTLVGSGVGLAADSFLPGAGLPLGVGLSMGANELQVKINRKRDHKRRPWVLAIDRLAQCVGHR